MLKTVKFTPNRVWTVDITFEYTVRRKKSTATVRTTTNTLDLKEMEDGFREKRILKYLHSKSAKFVRFVKIENEVEWKG